MSGAWKDCVITVIDVIGIKHVANQGGSRATSKMRALHALVQTSMNSSMNLHAQSYCWNDSVLLLGYWGGEPEEGRALLAEASWLKQKIDQKVGPSYAISIKGRAFPEGKSMPPAVTDIGSSHPKCIVLRASSYAMANCYLVEAFAKKKNLRADWYLDARIKEKIDILVEQSVSVAMLPEGTRRKVYLLNGYIE